MLTEGDREKFARLIEALRPALGQLIIVGGWAHRLYRLHPESSDPDHDPLLTNDTDVAIGKPGPPTSTPDLKARLLEHGFTEEFFGEDKPPVTHFHLKDANFYAEFLTPLVGSAYDKEGVPKATQKVGGVVAQSLRHLEVLFVAPWSITLSTSNGFELEPSAQVAIANPVSYIVQKLLISSRRKPGDRLKDALYIHDTIELFSSSLSTLRPLWTDAVQPNLSARARTDLRAARLRLFDQPNDDVRRAATIAADRPLDGATLLARCQAGLDDILGPS